MSALLSASILSRGLSPAERREERERVKLAAGGGGDGVEGSEARTAKMLLALDAAEEDLRSEAVPMRARGVVTLTRSVQCSWFNPSGDARLSCSRGVSFQVCLKSGGCFIVLASWMEPVSFFCVLFAHERVCSLLLFRLQATIHAHPVGRQRSGTQVRCESCPVHTYRTQF